MDDVTATVLLVAIIATTMIVFRVVDAVQTIRISRIMPPYVPATTPPPGPPTVPHQEDPRDR